MKYAITFVLSVVVSFFAIDFWHKYNQSQTVNLVPQETVCLAQTDEEAKACPVGQLFLASMLALEEETYAVREQRLLNTIVSYCDFNFPIASSNAGVMCVLTHDRL